VRRLGDTALLRTAPEALRQDAKRHSGHYARFARGNTWHHELGRAGFVLHRHPVLAAVHRFPTHLVDELGRRRGVDSVDRLSDLRHHGNDGARYVLATLRKRGRGGIATFVGVVAGAEGGGVPDFTPDGVFAVYQHVENTLYTSGNGSLFAVIQMANP
jgi:hypothetical protein